MQCLSREELLRWSKSQQARSDLPELVARLIVETAPPGVLTRLRFPSGATGQLPGSDGFASSTQKSLNLPDGDSIWEFTVSTTKKKFSDDYNKRTLNTEPSHRKRTSYIHLCANPLSQKDKWLRQIDPNQWHQVHILDFDDLYYWLLTAPYTTVWLAELIGRTNWDYTTIATWWKEYSTSTTPPTPASLFTLGNSTCVESLESCIGTKPILTLTGLEEDFHLAFAAAVALSGKLNENLQPNLENEDAHSPATNIYNQTLIVNGCEALSILADPRRRGLLILTPEASNSLTPRDIENLKDGNCRVILTGKHSPPEFHKLKITRNRYDVSFEIYKSNEIPREIKRHREVFTTQYYAFRRRICRTMVPPKWTHSEHKGLLSSLMLLGSWDINVSGDLELIAKVGGNEAQKTLQDLYTLTQYDDSPICITGTIWRITDPLDVMKWTKDTVTDLQLDQLISLAPEVLLERDSKWHDDESVRSLASIGKRSERYSPALRAGLAYTLALLGSGLVVVNSSGRTTGEQAARQISYKVLIEPKNFESLCDLSRSYSQIAEAAPDIFLDHTEELLATKADWVIRMFSNDDGLMGFSQHTELIWALERLAWCPDSFPRAILALGKLAELDPKHRNGNHPMESIASIFCPFWPQTCAPLAMRLEALHLLVRECPSISSEMLTRLFPNGRSSFSSTLEPNFRPYGLLYADPTRQPDVQAFYKALSDLLLDHCAGSPSILSSAVKQYGTLLPEHRSKLRDLLRDEWLGQDNSVTVADSLRILLAYDQPFLLNRCGVHMAEIDDLRELLSEWNPSDISLKHRWLFSQVAHATFDPGDFSKPNPVLHQQRIEAMRELSQANAFNDLMSISERYDFKADFGFVLAEVFVEIFDWDDIYEYIVSTAPSITHSLYCCLSVIAKEHPREFQELILRLSEASSIATAIGLCHSGSSTQLKELLVNMPVETAKAFWETWDWFLKPWPSPEDADWFIEKSLDAGFAYGVLLVSESRQMLTLPTKLRILSVLSKQLLESTDTRAAWGLVSHYVQHLISSLTSESWEELEQAATWELIFLASDHNSPLLHLERACAIRPQFFVFLISIAFKPRSAPEGYSSGYSESIANAAWSALGRMRFFPGSPAAADGLETSDPVRLVRESLALAKEADRYEVCCVILGEILARVPVEAGELFPSVKVCSLLEAIAEPDVFRGFRVGVKNLRGAFWKAPGDGGQQERDLASEFATRADAIKFTFPRVSRELSAVSRSYFDDARTEDLRDD